MPWSVCEVRRAEKDVTWDQIPLSVTRGNGHATLMVGEKSPALCAQCRTPCSFLLFSMAGPLLCSLGSPQNACCPWSYAQEDSDGIPGSGRPPCALQLLSCRRGLCPQSTRHRAREGQGFSAQPWSGSQSPTCSGSPSVGRGSWHSQRPMPKMLKGCSVWRLPGGECQVSRPYDLLSA